MSTFKTFFGSNLTVRNSVKRQEARKGVKGVQIAVNVNGLVWVCAHAVSVLHGVNIG